MNSIQICRWPVLNKMRMTIVVSPEARSLTIIIILRLERSTIAPRRVEAINIGQHRRNRSSPGQCCIGLFIRPDGHGKLVMLVPSREMICPTQTMEKPNMPVDD